jgi:biopolymer transport protein ExbD
MDVGGKQGGAMATMNVVPLIDILLVLIIIFMVITPLTPKGLDALVPQPAPPNQKQEQQTLQKTIVVQILDTGKLKINDEDATWDSLGPRLSDVFKERAEKVAFVKGDDNVRFAEVARAIDIMRSSGIDKVGLITANLEVGSIGGWRPGLLARNAGPLPPSCVHKVALFQGLAGVECAAVVCASGPLCGAWNWVRIQVMRWVRRTKVGACRASSGMIFRIVGRPARAPATSLPSRGKTKNSQGRIVCHESFCPSLQLQEQVLHCAFHGDAAFGRPRRFGLRQGYSSISLSGC